MEDTTVDPKQNIKDPFTPFAAPLEQKGAFTTAAAPEQESAFAAAL